MNQSERCWCLLPTKVCSEAAGELRSDPATDFTKNLFRNSHAKASNAFCLAHVPHEQNRTLLTAFLSTKTSTVHWTGKHTPGFFLLLAKLSLPSCGKIRFFLWLPLCSCYLFNMRQKNNFFFSSLLPYGDILVAFGSALPPRELFKGWQETLYTSYPNKGPKGWK